MNHDTRSTIHRPPRKPLPDLLHPQDAAADESEQEEVGERDRDAPRITRTAADEFLDSMHSDVGYKLLLKWNLPEIYAVVCRDHHRPDYDTTNILLVAVRLANLVCQKLGVGLQPDKDLVLVTCSEAGVLALSDIVLAELEIAVEDYLSRGEF